MSKIVDFNLMINEIYKGVIRTYQNIGSALGSICDKFIFQLEGDIISNVKYFHAHCRYIHETVKSDALQSLIYELNIFDLADAIVYPIDIPFDSRDFSYLMTSRPITGPWKDSDFRANNNFMPFEEKSLTAKSLTAKSLTVNTLYPFQKSLYDMSNNCDYTTIDVIYDPIGGSGKTVISKYLADHNNCYILPNCNDYQKILLDAYNHAISLRSHFGDGINSRCRNIKAMIIDLSGDHMVTPLIISALETIKRGKLFDCRYSYKIHRIEPPRIFIYCNKISELSFFSNNCFTIWTIENKILVHYL